LLLSFSRTTYACSSFLFSLPHDIHACVRVSRCACSQATREWWGPARRPIRHLRMTHATPVLPTGPSQSSASSSAVRALRSCRLVAPPSSFTRRASTHASSGQQTGADYRRLGSCDCAAARADCLATDTRQSAHLSNARTPSSVVRSPSIRA
jgi:hypothetical protein